MDFNLERFVEAQDAYGAYDSAIVELENGEKTGHWMWYVFPQMRGLGRSAMAMSYGISSLYEAHAYMCHDVLSDRLTKATETLCEHNYGREIESVMGGIDAMKLKSCLTLFDAVEPGGVFDRTLRYFFDEERDELTLSLIADDQKALEEDVWEDFRVKYPERAFFDDGCYEADKLKREERRATFLDLVRRGHSVVALTWRYLIGHRDVFDHYRTTNTENTLRSVGFYCLLDLHKWLSGQIDPAPATQLSALFPLSFFKWDGSMTWEIAAYRLDALFKFMLGNPKLSALADSQIKQFSLLPQQ